MDSTPLPLNVLLSIEGVREHVSYYLYRFLEIIFEYRHHVGCVLPGRVCIQTTTNILYTHLQLLASSILCPFEMEMLQEMSCPAVLCCLVSTSTSYEHAYWG